MNEACPYIPKVNQYILSSKEIERAVTLVLEGKANLVDVRSSEEFQNLHAKPAINFDFYKLKAGENLNLDKNIPVYVYCASGSRSALALIILHNQGFKEVNNIGSLNNWFKYGGN